MADSKPHSIHFHPGNEEKNQGETHGTREDIDENTPLGDVRAPNVFERAKEEVEAIIQTVHPKKQSPTRDEARKEDAKLDKPSSPSENEVKTPRFLDKANEKIEKLMKHESSLPRHHKETHGMRDDINENTPVDDVRGPNVFERAKEEIEAVLQTIHPKKEEKISATTEKRERGGFRAAIGKGLEKVCSPRSSERSSPPHHHKETHGMSNDIDENTPVDDVKGPNVFERAKEELEAVLQTIHPKKEEKNTTTTEKRQDGGFRATIGKGLEKVCSPRSSERS